MSVWIIFLIAIVFILLTISTVLYFFQDQIIFHAEKLPQNYKFSFNRKFKEINLQTDDSNSLNGILFTVNQPKGLILFFHNHSGNIEHWSRSAIFFNNFNYDVLLMDYRGYGKSTGKYNEQVMFSDALLWYNYAKNIYDENLITIYGRGIGATFATYIASLNNPKQLLLESPLYNMFVTAKVLYPYLPNRLISKYKFDTAAYITEVNCKIYIFHGEGNELVNFKNGKMLYDLVADRAELILISDGNHYNLISNETYLNKIREILGPQKI